MATPAFAGQMAFSSDATGYLILGRGTLGTTTGAKLLGQFSESGFTPITSRLMAFRAERGRDDDLAGMRAGTLELDLDDADGALDPENAASPYYPNVTLMKRGRVVATLSGTDYPLGYAFADDYRAQPEAVDANVGVHFTDLFTRMSRERADVDYPEQSTADRLNALLNELQWPSGLRAIDAGTLTLPAATVGKTTTMLAHVDAICKAEMGQFFIAGDGSPTFHNRVRRYLATSRGTFGAGGLAVRSVQTSFNDAGLLNRVSVTRTGGTEQVAEDAASQITHDVRGYSLDQDAADLLPSDGQALSWATTVVNRRAQPAQRVTGIELDPADDATLWGHVLDAEIGDKITLSHDVPGTKGLTATDFFIESIRHEFNPENNPPFLCAWGLSKAPTLGAFLLGSNRLGTASYLAY